VSDGPGDAYSALADQQLAEIEATDVDLYDDILTACEFILDHPHRALAMSATIVVTKPEPGTIRRFTVVGRASWKIFWDAAMPRIEAIIEYPT
jgi:hypothetical protein